MLLFVWAELAVLGSAKADLKFKYSLIQKNGDTFAIVCSSRCFTVFLNQTIDLRDPPQPWTL